MSGIAFILSQQGYKVTGSDLVDSKITRKLKALGTKVYIGHDEKNISPEMDEVVVSSAVPEKNPEIIAARRYKIPIIKRSRVLGELMALKRGVAVTGTHGKTTTSTMIGLILEAAKLDPTILVGGEVKNIGGNFKVGKGDFFVAEACEFDRSFLDLVAEVAVITNIEADHLDYYKDLEEIIEAFGQFIEKIPPKGLLVINGDDKNAAKVAARAKCKVVSFGIKNGDWKA